MLRGRSTGIALAAILALAPLSAQALTINDVELNGNSVLNFSSPGELDLNSIFFNTMGPIWLQVVLDTDDIQVGQGQLALSALVDNLSGVEWTDFHISLENDSPPGALFPTPTFAEINAFSANNGAGSVIQLGNSDTAAWIFFDAPEPSGFILGNPSDAPDPEIDPNDWFINLNGLTADQSFLIHLEPSFDTGAVPEPVSAALGLMGIAALSAGLRRRRMA